MPNEILPPIVVDMGKVSRKKVKKLKRGRGALIDDIEAAVAEVVAEAGLEGKVVVPVITVVKPKPRKRDKMRFPRFF